jgi:hypothetical protein
VHLRFYEQLSPEFAHAWETECRFVFCHVSFYASMNPTALCGEVADSKGEGQRDSPAQV